ncbi:MAG: hypothetical protein M3R65_09090 [Gemmatimonadota bacterium]|nr:hypothetical protein [Gemmatimonadota bacterium]
MARSYGYQFGCALMVTLGSTACHSADQDRTERRRAAARQVCEQGILDQLASRATAQFQSGEEHVYYDSTGGAAVAGTVVTTTGVRNFACIVKPATDSTWLLSGAKFMD